jgi:phage/plasmid-associated DNA primase
MKDAFLVCFNEVNKSNFFNLNDKKKAIITDSNININIKGISEFNIPSYHRFIAFTNNPDPATKNKRRDLFIQCSNEKVGNEEYFNEGFTYANDLECCAYIYNYFMKLPTKVKINSVDIPKTDYDEIIEEAQENPIVSFIKDFVIENSNLTERTIDVEDLYNNYRDYCCANDISLESMNKLKFGVRLQFIKGQHIIKERKNVNKKVRNIYTFNIPELIKHHSLTD